ncbi:hypothetical protein [Sphingomonas sp.]|uniref:hypothetical protein n=1 Tax=Sphingomonas sp. TaxID=28214 RepID=UPI001DEE1733|nr:hypothetical protein [Sphingomonas sp.]MBX9797604.1 hypothetical protein [Sphingomonas sp.]
MGALIVFLVILFFARLSEQAAAAIIALVFAAFFGLLAWQIAIWPLIEFANDKPVFWVLPALFVAVTVFRLAMARAVDVKRPPEQMFSAKPPSMERRQTILRDLREARQRAVPDARKVAPVGRRARWSSLKLPRL